MDPKRKKIYIAIIIISVLLAVIVLLWGRSSAPTLDLGPSPATDLGLSQPTTASTSPETRITDEMGQFLSPRVFPDSTTFDSATLYSAAFKSLKPYEATVLGPNELGRENPFNSY